MAARSKARKRALDILFEADSKGVPALSVLAEHVRRRHQSGDPELNEFTVELVEGVLGHQAEIDSRILAAAQGWTMDRMPLVDRAVLRLGTFEVLFRQDIPTGVAISEAVRLATDLSTDESPSFVNGVLASIAAQAPEATVDAPA